MYFITFGAEIRKWLCFNKKKTNTQHASASSQGVRGRGALLLVNKGPQMMTDNPAAANALFTV